MLKQAHPSYPKPPAKSVAAKSGVEQRKDEHGTTIPPKAKSVEQDPIQGSPVSLADSSSVLRDDTAFDPLVAQPSPQTPTSSNAPTEAPRGGRASQAFYQLQLQLEKMSEAMSAKFETLQGQTTQLGEAILELHSTQT